MTWIITFIIWKSKIKKMIFQIKSQQNLNILFEFIFDTIVVILRIIFNFNSFYSNKSLNEYLTWFLMWRHRWLVASFSWTTFRFHQNEISNIKFSKCFHNNFCQINCQRPWTFRILSRLFKFIFWFFIYSCFRIRYLWSMQKIPT